LEAPGRQEVALEQGVGRWNGTQFYFFSLNGRKDTLSHIRWSQFNGSIKNHTTSKQIKLIVKQIRFDEIYTTTVSDLPYNL
jgi:hypothetical protein